MLVDEINNSELFDKRYDVIRKDRDNKKKRGGGVLLALKKNIHFQVIYIYYDKDILKCLVAKLK